MLVDAHHHLSTEANYADRLVAVCDGLDIARVCVFGAGSQHLQFGIAGNDGVAAAAALHPDRLVPFAVFELGIDPPSLIDTFAHRGFKGIKFINPARNYDDREYWPVYGRVEGHGLPALFHLGIVARTPVDRHYDIDNNRHRPIYLDTIARAFPDMTLIGAHLGNPWYEEATMSCRWNPNLYFDLSGSTLKKKSPQVLGELLWWTPHTRYRDPERRHAWQKIVFGSDVPAEEIQDVLSDYRRVLEHLEIEPAIRDEVLGGTMSRLLGLDGC